MVQGGRALAGLVEEREALTLYLLSSSAPLGSASSVPLCRRLGQQFEQTERLRHLGAISIQ